MELIKILNNEDIMIIEDNKENMMEAIKEVTGIKENYNIGDTAVQINNVIENGFYKNVWNEKTFYYIVLNVIDEDLGYAISLW